MSQAEGVVKFIRDAAHTGACRGEPDAELVRRFASDGDEQAFRALVARYGPVVWAVCRRLARNHHDAEDAFQATFLVFARRAGGLRAGAAVGGWLYAVAYRVAARIRSGRRAESAEAEPADGAPGGALDELTVREAEAALHEELARLPEKYREPLVLCCLEGLSRDEAAARLGWSVNRVKHGLEQGRERLRSRLARRGVVLGVPLITGLLATPAGAVPPALAEAVVKLATGTALPSAAISSLATGVTRTMWFAKWKWALAGCAALMLTAGGTLAALHNARPEAPPVAPMANAANAEPLLALGAPEPPKPAAEPKKESRRAAWEVAADYLQLIIDGKPEQALKLGDKLPERYVKEIQTAGLKRVKFEMILINDSRVLVVTERAKLKRRPNAEETDEHVAVTLERKDADSPWRVRENDVADEKKVLREIEPYLDDKFAFAPSEEPKKEPERPKASWDVAAEFLKLALVEKTADALKLTVPGTVSENKVGEIKKAGFTGTRVVGVLLNDTRTEVIFEKQQPAAGTSDKADGHLVLMLTTSKDGTRQVKDIDFRDEDAVEARVKLYLDGRYDTKAEKK